MGSVLSAPVAGTDPQRAVAMTTLQGLFTTNPGLMETGAGVSGIFDGDGSVSCGRHAAGAGRPNDTYELSIRFKTNNENFEILQQALNDCLDVLEPNAPCVRFMPYSDGASITPEGVHYAKGLYSQPGGGAALPLQRDANGDAVPGQTHAS